MSISRWARGWGQLPTGTVDDGGSLSRGGLGSSASTRVLLLPSSLRAVWTRGVPGQVRALWQG